MIDPDNKIILSVFDSGVGIKKKNQNQLFKMFGRISATQKINTKGIGLGLVISKMISEEFGGMVNLRSKYGYGSVFQSSFMAVKDNG